MFAYKHVKLLRYFYVFFCVLFSFIAGVVLQLIREENGTEIQAIIQPGKLFVFRNICVLFFLHDLHDQWNHTVQQPGLG